MMLRDDFWNGHAVDLHRIVDYALHHLLILTCSIWRDQKNSILFRLALQDHSRLSSVPLHLLCELFGCLF